MITTTSQLIALVESNNDPSALRFEPLWSYVTPELIAICRRSHSAYMNDATARALMMFSYGRHQIMGSVLYELGYRARLSDFLTSTTLQDAWFTAFLRSRKIGYTLDELRTSPINREYFAKKYNGDKVGYARKMVSLMKANKVEVIE